MTTIRSKSALFSPNFSKLNEIEQIVHHLDHHLLEIMNRFNSFYTTNKEYLIQLCHTNDFYGNPQKYNFPNFTECSPSNLRYILHGLLILTYMKECLQNNVDIIEIGGGYGGLCFFIQKLSPLFDITVNTYSIFDLEMPSILQKKYLETLNIYNTTKGDLNNVKNLKENSFLISNYAFSEISSDLQKKYTDNVLNPYVSYGFLAWNFIDVYKFIDNKNIVVEDEFPCTGSGNKYVRFSPS